MFMFNTLHAESNTICPSEATICKHNFFYIFMHLADAFIQSDLYCIQALHFCQYVCSLGIEPTTFCAANAMLYH